MNKIRLWVPTLVKFKRKRMFKCCKCGKTFTKFLNKVYFNKQGLYFNLNNKVVQIKCVCLSTKIMQVGGSLDN